MLQLLDLDEEFKQKLFLSMPFEVCPITLGYETHKFFHDNEFKSDIGYSKSTIMNVEKCAGANTPRKNHLHRRLLVNGDNQAHSMDIFLFVDNLDCQLQLNIIDEINVTKSSSLVHSCNLCENYVFPAEFDQQECHVSSIINGNGEIPVICYCMGWLNEYTINGDKCFQGELVIQSNVMWDNFIAPTKYDIYPFDVCANIRRNRPLHCEQCRYIDHHTRVNFLYSHSNKKISVDVTFVVDKNCHLHIRVKQNGTALEFNDKMNWSYDERVPIEYSDSRCNVESTRDEKGTKNRICFKFGESRFQDCCYHGVIVLQKSIIDAKNRTTPESAVPVIYQSCAQPFSAGSPKLSTSHKEQCVHVNETIIRSLSWQNIDGGGHIENLEIHIARNESCELNLYGLWRGEHFHITFGSTNVKMEDQRRRDRICLGSEYIICFILPQQRSTNMGCIDGFLHWIVEERHAADFHRLLTEGDAHFKACPNVDNDCAS